MRIRKLLAIAAATVALGGCVSQSDFDAYRARIKVDGDNVDAWIAAAHQWIVWLNDNASTICPPCAPPGLPPDPPPDGGWQ